MISVLPVVFLGSVFVYLASAHYGASLVAHTVKNLHAMQETWVRSLGQEDPPGEGKGYPLLYSCLETSMDRGAWWAVSHGVLKSWM